MRNRNNVTLRLWGELPPAADLAQLLGIPATQERRKGERRGKHISRVQPFDVWLVELIGWGEWEQGEAPSEETARAAATLRRMVSGLRSLDRTKCRAELRVGVTLTTEWWYFLVAPEILEAAAAAQLELGISILDYGGNEDENEAEAVREMRDTDP